MKKLLLASAVAALSVTAANAAPTVYGKAFLTIDAQSADIDTTNTVTNQTQSRKTNNRPSLNSNGSRIGFKGSQALTANTDLLYQLEYGVTVDSDNQRTQTRGVVTNPKTLRNEVTITTNNSQFTSRDTYLGLSNAKFGTIMAGRLTGIDDAVNFADVTAGRTFSNTIVSGADRHNNAFAYASPNYNNMQILAMYGLDEDGAGREGYGLAGIYENGPLSAGASYIQLAGSTPGSFKNAFRLSGSYQLNPTMKLGALYQLSNFKNNNDESALSISGELQTATPWTAYAQGEVVRNSGGSTDDRFNLVVGGKYKFNKATTGHVYGGINKDEDTTTTVNTKVETTSFGVGGGIEYKF